MGRKGPFPVPDALLLFQRLQHNVFNPLLSTFCLKALNKDSNTHLSEYNLDKEPTGTKTNHNPSVFVVSK